MEERKITGKDPEWHRKYYRSNPERKRAIYASNAKRALKLYDEIDAYKIARGCDGCEFNVCAKALEFHHREPEAKKFTISLARSKAIADVWAEIAKCDLLCANCHRIQHCTDCATGRAHQCSSDAHNTQPALAQDHTCEGRVSALLAQRVICPDCKTNAKTLKALRCRSCASQLIPRSSKIKWPPIPALTDALASSSFSSVGRKLGVSDNAVRKHLRSCGVSWEGCGKNIIFLLPAEATTRE